MLILRVGDHRTPNLKEYRKAMNDPAIGEHCLVMIGTPEGNHATLLRKGKTTWLPETAALE